MDGALDLAANESYSLHEGDFGVEEGSALDLAASRSDPSNVMQAADVNKEMGSAPDLHTSGLSDVRQAGTTLMSLAVAEPCIGGSNKRPQET